jgi:PhoPQ-activated pathogenicity-related protein
LGLGGRPKEEGGHKSFNVSLDDETRQGLEKLHNKNENRSQFIEKALRPLLNQFDPGPSCEVLNRLDEILNNEISSAISQKDFEKVNALAALANSFEPFRSACRISTDSVSGQRPDSPSE